MKTTEALAPMRMKAIEYQNYGAPEVLQWKEVAKPTLKPNEVLIRVHASTVTAADIMMRTGMPKIGRLYLGLKAPKRKIIGFDFAGEVVEIGSAVSSFQIGDKVFGGTTTLGCYAEYLCVSEKDVVAQMPENIGYAEAAPVSGSAITVLNFLQGKGNIQKGQKVLIHGASGGLGTYAVQIAKHFGAEVTAVCSKGNLEMVKALGADHVVDYLKEDFTKAGKQYDIIFDTVGKRSFSECKKSLSKQGIYLASVASGGLLFQMVWTSLFGGKKAKTSSTGLLPVAKRLAYLMELRELLGTGRVKTVLDQAYPFAQTAAAHAYVELGHKKGNVVLVIAQ